jgi:hypothetical protein
MITAPEIELLWWRGCPSTDRALELLRDALVELGLGDTEVRLVEISNDEQAHRAGFAGSPTILIDGVDLVELAGVGDGAEAEAPGLSCRLYRRRDGRIAPTPDPADIRAALSRVVGARPPHGSPA